MDQLPDSIRRFAEQLERSFTHLGKAVVLPPEGTGDAANWSFCMVPPAHPSHRLQVVTRGNSVEVRYDDGEPPGPAEKLWVDLNRGPAAVADEVIRFLRELMSGRMVVVRERLGPVSSRLRGDGCKSLAWFRHLDELSRASRSDLLAIHSWTGDLGKLPHDGPPTAQP